MRSRRSGVDVHRAALEQVVRVAQGLGIEAATGPSGFPLGIGDALRANGIALTVDQGLFDDRRRRKTEQELAAARRAQRAAEAGVGGHLALSRRARERGSRYRRRDVDVRALEGAHSGRVPRPWCTGGGDGRLPRAADRGRP